jgi:hypothetical protein
MAANAVSANYSAHCERAYAFRAFTAPKRADTLLVKHAD